jgi:hypothetical protein
MKPLPHKPDREWNRRATPTQVDELRRCLRAADEERFRLTTALAQAQGDRPRRVLGDVITIAIGIAAAVSLVVINVAMSPRRAAANRVLPSRPFVSVNPAIENREPAHLSASATAAGAALGGDASPRRSRRVDLPPQRQWRRPPARQEPAPRRAPRPLSPGEFGR